MPNNLVLQFTAANTLQHALEFSLHGCTDSKLSFFLSTCFSCTKTSCVKKLTQPIQIYFLWLPFLTHTLPQADCTQPPCAQ
jgi:hypothetical protein